MGKVFMKEKGEEKTPRTKVHSVRGKKGKRKKGLDTLRGGPNCQVGGGKEPEPLKEGSFCSLPKGEGGLQGKKEGGGKREEAGTLPVGGF